MPEINPTKFSIDSVLELPADHFDAQIQDSTIFQTADPVNDRVTLQAGLLSGTGSQMLVTQLKQGIIDEYELIITPTNIQANIHGRDPMAFVLDYFYKKRYIRVPSTSSIESVTTPSTIPSVSGQFPASQIAKEAVAFAGLTLSWEVRDYVLQETFDAVGRVIDILRKLIRPWTLVEPFKAEIFMANGVLVVRQRVWPITSPDLTLNLTDMKRERVTVRKRKTKKIGLLTLRGQRVSDALSPKSVAQGSTGINDVFIAGSQTEEDTAETFAEGKLISIVHRVSVYSMPQHNLQEETKETFGVGDTGGVTLTIRETTTNDWEVLSFDTSGQTSQPSQIGSLITRERVDASDPDALFRLWDEDTIGYTYDGTTFQTGESRLGKSLNLDAGTLDSKTLTVKTMRDKGNLLIEYTTENYTYVPPASGSGPNVIQLQFRDTQTQGGHRPGGPGRKSPRTRSTTAGQPSIGGSRQIETSIQLSTDPDAQDFEFSDTNLTGDDLDYLVSLFTAAQGLFEYEVQFEGVGMPWIVRGLTIGLFGIMAEDGVTPILIPKSLITEVRTTYQEDSTFRYSSLMRAFGYLST